MDKAKPTVVVIDDNPTMKVLFERSTLKLPIRLVFHTLAKNSIDYLQSNVPDLIFLSLILPDKSGQLLLEEIREMSKQKDTLVIVISSKNYAQDRMVAKNFGVVEFLAKPMPMQLIRQMIIRYTGVSGETLS